ncbi:hypothetical protein ROZALSC1DRAFT_29107, partial [Rozella allomycis CSF55]
MEDVTKSFGFYDNIKRSIFRDVGLTMKKKFKKYLVPDDLNVFPLYSLNTDVEIYLSQEEYSKAKSLEVSAQADVNYFGASFGFSSNVNSQNSEKTSNENFIAVYVFKSKCFHIHLNPLSMEYADENFKGLVEEWLDIIEQNEGASTIELLKILYPHLYRFFRIYGTTFVNSADFGGSLVVQAEKSKSSSENHHSLGVQASAYFKNAFASVSLSVGHDEEEKVKKFKENSKVTYNAQGGSPEASKMVTEVNNQGGMKEGFEKWLSTVEEYPSVIGFTLKPIYYLLEDLKYKKIRPIVKVATEMFHDGVPALGDVDFLIEGGKNYFSSNNVLENYGSGHISFKAMIQDNINILFASAPQHIRFTLTLNLDRSSYKICSIRDSNKEVCSVDFIPNFLVSQGVYESYAINIYDNFLVLNKGQKSTLQDAVVIDLTLFKSDLSGIKYVGFSMTSKLAATSISITDIEIKPPVVYNLKIESCVDIKRKFIAQGIKSFEDGNYTILVHGVQVEVVCFQMNTNSPKEYIAATLGNNESEKDKTNVQIRFIPELMALDLCDIREVTDKRNIYLSYKDAPISHTNIYLTLPGHLVYNQRANRLHKTGGPFPKIESSMVNKSILKIKISDSEMPDKKYNGKVWYGNMAISHKYSSKLLKCSIPNSNNSPSSRMKSQMIFSDFNDALYSQYKALSVLVEDYKLNVKKFALNDESYKFCPQ